MGIGKRRISTAARLGAKAEEEQALGVVTLVRPIARVEELGLVIDLAAVRELEHVQVAALELAIVLAAGPETLEREIVPAEELEHVPVAVELGLVRVAVAPRTKSEIGLHRRDPVPLLAAEDLAAAAAETLLGPVAAEAATAWAAAVEEEEAVVAVADGDKHSMRKNK